MMRMEFATTYKWFERRIKLFVKVFLLVLLSACQSSNETVREVDMYNDANDLVGTATLTEHPEGVNVKLKVEGLSPGFHGFHVHEFSSCEPPHFKSAGNHLNPEGNEHGLMHPKGAHLGDFPNIEADDKGEVDVELLLEGATLLEDKNSLLKEQGTSLIVAEKQDDGISQPAGDSGARIICGELKSKQEQSKESPTDPTETNTKEES